MGDSDIMTAIAVPVPEAEPLVGAWRSKHDPSGAWGMQPHVTLLVPFRRPKDVNDALLAELGALFAEMPSFTCRFEKTARFPGVLYLAPEPRERFLAMTDRLVARYPEYPPYGGAYKRVVPHLTVLDDCADCLCTRVAARLEEGLPLEAEITEVLLLEGSNASPGWTRRASFPLGLATA